MVTKNRTDNFNQIVHRNNRRTDNTYQFLHDIQALPVLSSEMLCNAHTSSFESIVHQLSILNLNITEFAERAERLSTQSDEINKTTCDVVMNESEIP